MHACPVKNCSESIGDTKLMCQAHWLSVDSALRAAVLAAYAALKAAAGTQGPVADEARRHYMLARQAVIDQANAAEAEARQMLADELRKAWVFNEDQLEMALGQWANDRNPVGSGEDAKCAVVREFLSSDAAKLHRLSMGAKP